MAARFQSRYQGPTKKTTVKQSSTADIGAILMRYFERPSLRQLYKVWAESCSDLTAEVDRQLPEVRREKGDPDYQRIALWNTLAAERYNATSEEEKEETKRKAKNALSEQTKKWKEGLAEPKSLEEAAR